MRILLISYGDLDYDGRLRSLISVFERLGKVYPFTKRSNFVDQNEKLHSHPIQISLKIASNMQKAQRYRFARS